MKGVTKKLICSSNLKPSQKENQETSPAPIGGNILPFFSGDVGAPKCRGREYGNLKKPERFAPKLTIITVEIGV